MCYTKRLVSKILREPQRTVLTGMTGVARPLQMDLECESTVAALS